MAYPQADRLTLLPLPQYWDPDATVIGLRVVVLPRGNPLDDLMTGTPGVADGPAFADAELRLRVGLIPSTQRLPDPADVTAWTDLTPAPAGERRSWYDTLGGVFDIDPAIEANTANPGAPDGRSRSCWSPATSPPSRSPGPGRRTRSSTTVTPAPCVGRAP